MRCKNPYMSGVMPYGCGQCLPCTIDKRRLWAHRMMLETRCHEVSSFITLTYAPEHLPADGSLVPKHLADFLKRLRFKYGSVRFYAVGEYGDENFRPHYHLALFGYPPCAYGLSRYRYGATKRCCPACDFIVDTWSMGRCTADQLTLESAGYVAGYITKKMTKASDPRLKGRYPEFSRMSRKPGIGALAMKTLASALQSPSGRVLMVDSGDVPVVLQTGGKSQPLGRYLRRKLREELGFEHIGAPRESLERQRAEMFDLYKDTKLPEYGPSRSHAAKEFLLERNKQKVLTIEARALIYKKKGTV